MHLRASELVTWALEDEGVRLTFGIPGTHNIELYDSLERSTCVDPVLVTDEQSATFMADAVSRCTGLVGVANVVPGAGVTHAMSGVAEAFMDNVPMVVLTCGIRNDTGKAYQLHDVDQLSMLSPVTKATLRPQTPGEVYELVRRAFAIARSGAPGPVAVEIPANYYTLAQDVPPPDRSRRSDPVVEPARAEVDAAVARLRQARHPALYVGNGARAASTRLVELAERLGAPVATTIQGKGVFPEQHPLWLWNGFGASAPPFVRGVMDRCDCLLAIGCRFGEVATASYGLKPPEELIHVDIDERVFHRNYPARQTVVARADLFVERLLERLGGTAASCESLRHEIAAGHSALAAARGRDASRGRVSPAALFGCLQRMARPDTVYATDSGNGTFLAMEHLRLAAPGLFLAPVDFSCMGYSVPAAIGAKLALPERDVVALAGDGALLMTGLELITAAARGAAPLVCVLRDQELGQIVQFQRTALDRDTCSVLSPYSVEDLARAVRCRHVRVSNDSELGAKLEDAFQTVRGGRPVLAEIDIDYSCKTFFTRGVVSTNFWRLPWPDRLRMAARVAGRKLGLLK
ncbi:MAG: thiamine pyrophosphate-binding protein [Candidatus Wallbacteria bacterium]|nr:thiamine pyrophosphate-binding protein [Candidatus Wallbacteria bacterium]